MTVPGEVVIDEKLPDHCTDSESGLVLVPKRLPATIYGPLAIGTGTVEEDRPIPEILSNSASG